MDDLKDTTPEQNEENTQDLQDNAESESNDITLEQVFQMLQDSNGRIENLEKQLSELSPVAEETTEESPDHEVTPEESTEESETDESVESNEEKEISEDELKAVDELLQNR